MEGERERACELMVGRRRARVCRCMHVYACACMPPNSLTRSEGNVAWRVVSCTVYHGGGSLARACDVYVDGILAGER